MSYLRTLRRYRTRTKEQRQWHAGMASGYLQREQRRRVRLLAPRRHGKTAAICMAVAGQMTEYPGDMIRVYTSNVQNMQLELFKRLQEIKPEGAWIGSTQTTMTLHHANDKVSLACLVDRNKDPEQHQLERDMQTHKDKYETSTVFGDDVDAPNGVSLLTPLV